MEKLTIEIIRERTSHYDSELVSNEYHGTMEPLAWRCKKCGTMYEATYHRMYHPKMGKSRNICPTCGRKSTRKSTLTIEIIRDRTKDHDLMCLSKEFRDAFVEMEWQCTKCNSIFLSPYNRVQRAIRDFGTNGCERCHRAHTGDRSRLNEESINHRLEQEGRDVRIEKYAQNTLAKSRFYDSHGHKWEAAAEHVLYGRKNGCPVCQRINHRTKEEQIIQRLKEECDGITLVSYSGKASSKSEFVCKNGHSFFASAANVLCRKTGCKQCIGKSEDALFSLMAKSFSINPKNIKRHFMLRPYCRFADFLLEHNGRKIWIEYDGIQHFRPMLHWGGSKALEIQRQKDAKDPAIAKELGYELHRIRYDEDKREAIKRILS